MKILFVASEASTLAEVGGLAEVIGSLPKALIGLGHDVRVMIPRYKSIEVNSLKLEKSDIKLSPFADNEVINLYSTLIKQKIPVYLIDNRTHFSTDEIYGGSELDKFLFFSRAVVDFLPAWDWQPQIVHCNDWHTSLVPMWLKTQNIKCSSILTIHNLAYQGWFDNEFMLKHRIDKYWQGIQSKSPLPLLNFLCQGILNADLITAVSENYSKEILTPELGEGLENYLKYREQDLFGIVNGIDYEVYNPANDRYLAKKYSPGDIIGKKQNKKALQKRAGLPVKNSPLIGLVQRLEEQKGIDILDSAIHELVRETDLQISILGKGRESYEKSLMEIANEYPDRVAVSTAYDDGLAHMIYSGSDMFLMPSKFEPCGLGQLIAMKYGTIPVVRHTGGLVDTVPPFNEDLSDGNGFVFKDYSSAGLTGAVKNAINAYNKNPGWERAISRLMKNNFSWDESAKKYVKIYEKALIINKSL